MHLKTRFFKIVVLCLLGLGGGLMSCTTSKPPLPSTQTSSPPSPTITQTTLPTATATATPGLVPGPVTLGAAAVPYMQEVRNSGLGTIEAVAWSPDGEMLAFGGSLGVKQYYRQTDFLSEHFLDAGAWVSAVAYSPDSFTLAAGTANGDIFLWDALSEKLLHTFKGHHGKVLSLAFNPDGTMIASGGEDKTIILWDAINGKQTDVFPGQGAYVNALAFHPNGKVLFSLSDTLRIRDLQTGLLTQAPIPLLGSLPMLAVRQDGQVFYTFSSSVDGHTTETEDWRTFLTFWLSATGEPVQQIPLMPGYLWEATLSPDRQYAALTNHNNGFELWDVEARRKLATLAVGDGYISHLVFSPDNTMVVSISSGNLIRFWRVPTGGNLGGFSWVGSRVTGTTLSPDGKLLAKGGGSPCQVQIWYADGQYTSSLYANPPLLFSPDNQFLLTGSCDYPNAFHIWNRQSWTATSYFLGQGENVNTFAFNAEGTKFAVAGEYGSQISLYDLSGNRVQTLYTEAYSVGQLAFLPHQEVLAVSGGQIALWELKTGEKQRTLNSARYTSLMTVSPDGHWLAAVADDRVEVFDAFTGQALYSLQPDLESLKALQFSPDSSLLVLGGGAYFEERPDSEIQFWEATTGKWLGRWTNVHRAPVNSILFSEDGLTMYTTSSDGETKRWQAHNVPALDLTPTPTPVPTQTPPALPPLPFSKLPRLATFGKGTANATVWTPDHRQIIIGDDTGIHFYDPQTQQELAYLEIGAVMEFIFNPQGDTLAALSYNGVVILNWETRQVLLNANTTLPSAFAFAPDGHAFALLSNYCINVTCDFTLEYWTLDTHEAVYTFLLPSGNTRLEALALSPDGKLLAAAGGDRQIYVWDLQTGALKHMLAGHAGMINSLAFNATGNQLVSGSDDATVRLWQPQTGQFIQTFAGFSHSIETVIFTETDIALKIEVQDEGLWQLDLTSGARELLPTPPEEPDPLRTAQIAGGFLGYLNHLTFSPDGQHLVAESNGGPYVLMWDVPTRQVNFALKDSARQRAGLVFSPNGHLLAGADAWGEGLRVWNAATGAKTVAMDDLQVDSLAFSPDSQTLAVGSQAEIRLYDTQTWHSLKTLPISGDMVNLMAFSEDGRTLFALVDEGKRVEVWDLTTTSLTNFFEPVQHEQYFLPHYAFHFPWLALAEAQDGDPYGSQQSIALWDLRTGQRLGVLQGLSERMDDLAFSSDGSLLAATTYSTLAFWSIPNGQVLFTQVQESTSTLAFSPDGTLLAEGTEQGLVTLWEISALKTLAHTLTGTTPPAEPGSFQALPLETPLVPLSFAPMPLPTAAPGAFSPTHLSQITSVGQVGQGTLETAKWTPDGQTLFVGGSQGIFAYQTDTLELQAHAQPETWVEDLIAFPDHTYLLAGTQEGSVQTFKTEGAATNWGAGDNPQLSPNGQWLFMKDTEGAFALWNLTAPEILSTTLPEFGNRLATFSPDNQHLAFGSWEGTVYLWNLDTAQIEQSFGGPQAWITSLAFSEDGQKLAAGAGDGSLWVWQTRTGAPLLHLEIYPVGDYEDYAENWLTALSFSRDGHTLLVGAHLGQIQAFNLPDGAQLQTFPSLAGEITTLAFHPTQPVFLAVDSFSTLKIGSLVSGLYTGTLGDFATGFTGLSILENGQAAAWHGRVLWQFDLSETNIFKFTEIPTGTLRAVSPDGQWLGIENQNKAELWTSHLEKLLTLEGGPELISLGGSASAFNLESASFSPNSQNLVATGSGGAWIWEVPSGKILHAFPLNGWTDLMTCMAFHPDGKILATYSTFDGTFSLWDLQTRGLLQTFTPEGFYGCKGLTLSPDGKVVALVQPAQVGFWHLETGKSLVLSADETQAFTSLAFNPTQTLLAVGTDSGKILFLDPENLNLLATLEASPAQIDHLAFSLEGRVLLSAGKDGVIRVWGIP